MILQKNQIANLAVFSLLAFISVGPIYWFGDVKISIVSIFCYSLLAMFFLLSSILLVRGRQRVMKLVIFTYTELTVLVSCLLISSIATGYYESSFSKVSDFFFIYAIMFLVVFDKSVALKIKDNIWKTGWVIVFISPFILSNYLINLPNWTTPFSEPSYPLSHVGFAGSRTGWSVGVSLIYPLFIIGGYEYFKDRRVLLLLCMLSFLIAVAIPSGRTGILMCFFITVFSIYIYFKSNSFSIFIGVGVIVGIASYFYINADAFRLGSILYNEGDISSGRYEGVLIGLDIFANNFLFGTGSVDLLEFGLSYGAIHNLWVNLAAHYGVFVLLIFTLIILRLSLFCFKYWKSFSYRELSFALCVFVGIGFTFVEPGGIVGQMKLQSVFWVAFALLQTSERRYII